MHPFIIVLIALYAILALISLYLLIVPAGSRHKKKGPQAAQLMVDITNVRTKVTSARWYSEMLMDKEYGKLNLGQMELVHQIDQACQEAVETLDSFSKVVGENVSESDPNLHPQTT